MIKRGLNDIRDHDAKLADLSWEGVVVEPVLVPADDRNSSPALADWFARGVWEGNRVALFDNRIVDANAPSYHAGSSWDAIARKAAEAKKRKYARASVDMRSSFIPLVCSTDAVLHREYAVYQKRLASRLATKWDKPYSVVMACTWVRVQTQFAIIRAVDFRLCGTRRRLVGLTMQESAGLGIGH